MTTFVENWRSALDWHSVRISALGAFVAAGWMQLSEPQRAELLRFLGIDPAAAVLVTFVAVIVGRVLNQTTTKETTP